MPADQKELASSFERGAPPEIEYRMRVPECGADLRKTTDPGRKCCTGEEEVGRLLLHPELEDLPADVERPVKQLCFAAGAFETLSMTRAWTFSETRGTAAKMCGFTSTRCRGKLLDRLGVTRSSCRSGSRDTRASASRTWDSGRNESPTVAAAAAGLRGREDVRDEVALEKHRPLGLPGGTRGVDERREVVGLPRVRPSVERLGIVRVGLPPGGDDLLERGRPGTAASVEDDDVLQPRAAAPRVGTFVAWSGSNRTPLPAPESSEVLGLLRDHRREDRHEDRSVALAGEVDTTIRAGFPRGARPGRPAARPAPRAPTHTAGTRP